MGLRALSMRPASIGPVKHLLRQINLSDLHAVIEKARDDGHQSVRPAVMDFLSNST
jgi:phosphotransferase system enzyme I (PtsP)